MVMDMVLHILACTNDHHGAAFVHAITVAIMVAMGVAQVGE